MKNNCSARKEEWIEMLLEPAVAPVGLRAQEARTHLESCDHCRQELEALRATMGALDAWTAPEPTPYFLTRLNARLREERQTESVGGLAGWWARQRASFAFGSFSRVRSVAAMALTVLLLVTGGVYLGTTDWDSSGAGTASGQASVVHDLQNLDSNAQLLDQLETLSSNNDGEN